MANVLTRNQGRGNELRQKEHELGQVMKTSLMTCLDVTGDKSAVNLHWSADSVHDFSV